MDGCGVEALAERRGEGAGMVRMAWGSRPFPSLLFVLLLLPWFSSSSAVAAGEPEEAPCSPPLVTRENRKTIVSTDSGTISAVDIDDKNTGRYHLEFFTLQPQSLLLPLLLHADMVFYVQTGKGNVSWVDEDKIYELEVESGDIYRVGAGSVVYMRTPPGPTGEKLVVNAIFDTSGSDVSPDACVGPYSNLSDLIRGFDELVLRMAFKASPEVIAGIKGAEGPAPIVPFPAQSGTGSPATWKERFLEALVGAGRSFGSGSRGPRKKKGKVQKFNLLKARPDVENCYGRRVAVTDKLPALKRSVFGAFSVRLAQASMTGPHWNPLSTDFAIVTHGRGIVQLVLPNSSPGEGKPGNSSSGGSNTTSTSGDDAKPSNSSSAESACKCPSITFKAGEGDVFFVPRFHAVSHMSFNNDTFAFAGFRTRSRKNTPQLLAGKSSLLQTLDSEVLALSLGVSNATVGQLLASDGDADILQCPSCAEEELKKIEAEAEKKQQKKEEGEARRREEDEGARRQEEEAKKGEEEVNGGKQEEKKWRQEEESHRQAAEEEGAGGGGSEILKLRRVWIV